MLAILLSFCVSMPAVQQDGPPSISSAVAVRGDTELSPAAALASAKARADEHVRTVWRDRAERAAARRRPFWMPTALVDGAVDRWLADLPVADLVAHVDREDKERVHEFGNSYQTTLWIAERPASVEQGEQRLRGELRDLEHVTALKASGVAGGWLALALLLTWLDRLSRGYMTGRLVAIGLLGSVVLPGALFLL